VQLGNVAEFYMTFFALLQIGVAPVNALFSHQRSELNAYAAQIKPAVLIADRDHALFAGDDFLNALWMNTVRYASCCCAATGRARPGRGDCPPGG
jgi:non-ribosomal peptide synthetase component E (peptide arylation enzyme)